MDKLCAVCCGTCVWCDYNPKTDELMCKNPDLKRGQILMIIVESMGRDSLWTKPV